MSKYKAKKDVYCPHTGRLLFQGQCNYNDISESSGDIVLETCYGCHVSRYTITGGHANLEGCFTKVKVSREFNRSFSNRTGGIGDLVMRAKRFDSKGIDMHFSIPGFNGGEVTFFACLGANDCDKLAEYFAEVSCWIQEGE